MKKLSLRTFMQNLYSLWVYDYRKDHNDLKGKLEYFTLNLRWLMIQNGALRAQGTAADCAEFEFTRSMSEPSNFPYPQVKRLENVDILFDEEKGLSYILHKENRLYFPKMYSPAKCEHTYRYMIEKDQILGGGYLSKAPHCYQTDRFKVEEGDVLFDCGTAEGLFALSVIDKVSYAYLIEADKDWIPALEATFEPWKDKVSIINKFLSNKDNKTDVNLSTLLAKHREPCFVKMDIEGAETMVLEGCKEYLRTRNNIRLACCTYHYHEDAERLCSLFDEIEYKHEFSDGYTYFIRFDDPQPPYLRKAIIRSQRK